MINLKVAPLSLLFHPHLRLKFFKLNVLSVTFINMEIIVGNIQIYTGVIETDD